MAAARGCPMDGAVSEYALVDASPESCRSRSQPSPMAVSQTRVTLASAVAVVALLGATALALRASGIGLRLSPSSGSATARTSFGHHLHAQLLLESKPFTLGRLEATDGSSCCRPTLHCAEALDFSKSVMVHNNLDGQGPVHGEPSMVFKDVLPSRSEVVNLEVIATGPYNPADSASNGINAKKLGQINVASSSSVDLLFRLVQDSTWHPVALSGPLCVSVFNLEDEVTIGGFSQSALEEHSLLQVVNDSFGLTHVSGPSWPDARADPNTTRELEFVQPAALGSPNLTAAQRRRTVTFMFTSGPEFQLSFSAGASPVSGVTGGRDFIFGGLSPFVTIGA